MQYTPLTRCPPRHGVGGYSGAEWSSEVSFVSANRRGVWAGRSIHRALWAQSTARQTKKASRNLSKVQVPACFLSGCGGRIRTGDLQVMSLTSYLTALPRVPLSFTFYYSEILLLRQPAGGFFAPFPPHRRASPGPIRVFSSFYMLFTTASPNSEHFSSSASSICRSRS